MHAMPCLPNVNFCTRLLFHVQLKHIDSYCTSHLHDDVVSHRQTFPALTYVQMFMHLMQYLFQIQDLKDRTGAVS